MTAKLIIGMVGSGLMAEIYGTILKQRADCELRAVVGNTAEKTRAFAERFDASPYAGGDCRQMYLDHPDINLSIITTPEWVRIEPLNTAVEFKQHIILEKPVATCLSEALEIKRLLAEHKRSFEVCHVLRYSSRFVALKEAVASGKLGTVRHIHARRNSNSKRAQRVLGKTDLAFWLTPHDVDMMRWITGSEVTEVYALARDRLSSADDYLIANLRFANGVDAVLEISWCSPPVSGTSRAALFEVFGTQGIAEVDDFDMNVRIFGPDNQVASPDTYEDYFIAGHRRGIFEAMLNAYLARIKAGERNNDALSDAIATIEVCERIRQSLDAHGVVKCQ